MALKTITFYLRNSSQEYSSLRAKVSFNGLALFYPTGVTVKCSDWKNNKKISKNEKMQLTEVEMAITSTLLYYERIFKTPTQEEFKEKVIEFLSGSNAIDISRRDNNLIIFIEKYIKENEGVKAKYTINAYKLAYGKIKEFGGVNTSFADITLAFYKKFVIYLQQKGYSRNYIGSIIKNLCVFMSEAQSVYKLHKNEDYKQFKVEQETADSVYLSIEELERIHNLEITPELVREYYPHSGNEMFRNFDGNIDKICQSLKKVKNKFLIGALCALRISDYNRLSIDNIKDGVISIVPLKGSNLRKPEPVKIPVHPIMKEIIDSGFNINEKVIEQNLNKQIKVVCKMAGITEIVTHYRTMGGKLVEMQTPKYDLVSSHTARRSGATNMYLAGIPHGLIRVCTGHKTTEMLLKYIKVAYKEDNVKELKHYSYFGAKSEDERIIEHVKKALQSNEEPMWLKMIKEEIL